MSVRVWLRIVCAFVNLFSSSLYPPALLVCAVAFLLSSRAGGLGLNLMIATHLILFDPDWSPRREVGRASPCAPRSPD